MNKKILIIILLVAVAAICLMMSRKETPPKIVTAENEIPDFRFALITGDSISRSDLDPAKYTLIQFFNSECDYCIHETEAITDSISALKNCQILMVSHEDSAKVAAFYEKFGLAEYPAIHVAFAKEEYVKNMFKIYVVPTLYVYRPNKQMTKYKPGPVTVSEIVTYLK